MNATLNLQLLSYGLASVIYLILSVLLVTSFRGRLRGGLLLTAAFMSTVWALTLTWSVVDSSITSIHIFTVEFLHDTAWLVFLSGLMAGAAGGGQYWVIRYGGIILAIGCLAFGYVVHFWSLPRITASGMGDIFVVGSLLTALYVLVVVEQVYRNARESQRAGLKYLCLGVGGIFAYDLFLFSDAILTGQLDTIFWAARGFAVAMCVPLIAVAAQRSPSWSVGIFVSRRIIFYSTTVLGAGVYLTIIGVAGYYVKRFGGDWGPAAQTILFFAATIALFAFLSSERLRARVNVFISKHFYANKYDYRAEWIRLIKTLTDVDENLPLRKRAIKSVAQILDSPSGLLWIKNSHSEDFHCNCGWNVTESQMLFACDDSLVSFLENSGWIIDLREYRDNREVYANLEISPDGFGLKHAAYIVPLMHEQALLGFVVLAKPVAVIKLNFEDRDLLKTAGVQIASYLIQEISTERLSQGKQFEAFNKLTAYLMHDLKNVVAQQSLVVENAKRHKNDPRFIDDAISTIEGSVGRIKRVLEHIQQNPVEQFYEKIELGKLILQATSHCADREPLPKADVDRTQVWVRAEKDRLLMALQHAIRNAQDATEPDGTVTVTLRAYDAKCSIEISDTGHGMDPEFVRSRLFRPFDSTKGTQGMGIGAYQIRETVKALGGAITVLSEQGVGTQLMIELETTA